MKKLLWLDDYRNPFDTKTDWMIFSPIGRDVEIHWVKNYQEFVDWIIENDLPDGICFDHDLDDSEIWMPIINYEHIYEVSNYGRVKRILRSKGTSGNNILKPYKSESGLSVMLRNSGNDVSKKIHRLVMESFIGVNILKPEVNHKDGNRWNNYIGNLEWCTGSENVFHSHNELNRDYSAYGENHGNSFNISQYDKSGNYINTYGSVNEAGRQLKIEFTNIAKCARNERKTAGGFIWKYDNKKTTIKSEIAHIKDKDYTKNFFIPEIKTEKTGYDCAKWLVDFCLDRKIQLPSYNIQSANPCGRENINGLLKNYIVFFNNNLKQSINN